MTPLFRCIKEHGYIVPIAEVVPQYVDVSSSNLSLENLDVLAFDSPFYRLLLYSHTDSWVRETILERRLKARGDGCCFINWHYIDVYRCPVLAPSRLFLFQSQICGSLMRFQGYYSCRRLS